MKIEFYKSINENILQINAFMDIKSLEICLNNSDVACIEMEFSLDTYNDDNDEDQFPYFKNVIESFINDTFLIYSGYMFENTNRIRRYKGLFPKEIKLNSLLNEIELFEDEHSNQSAFVGAVKIDLKNMQLILDKIFHDSSRAFVLLNTKINDILSDRFLDETFRNSIINKGNLSWNYTSIIEKFVKNEGLLMRNGGDHVNYFSLQIFGNINNKKLNELLNKLTESEFNNKII